MIQKLKRTFIEKTAKIIVVFGVALIYFWLNTPVHAATLYLYPTAGSYSVGKTFSMSIYVSSPDQAENASQATINFPADKLEIISLSKSDSILTLWVAEPIYSNTDGVVRFAGIIPNPGFIGQSGKLLTVLFRAKDSGSAHIDITKGSVLANDGQGTQILTSVGSADFLLEGKPVTGPGPTESVTPPGAAGTPLAPQISSPTHPDPGKWYSNSDPIFDWQVPSEITAAKLSYSRNYNSYPNVVYAQPISEKKLENVEDGIYYFNVQLRNRNGWGAVSRFKFQIDTQAPEPFQINFVDGKETDNPQPRVIFKTTDALSGVDYYKIKIGDGDFFVVPASEVGNEPYVLPLQDPGKKTILVQAFDKAGNSISESDEFLIKPINAPLITDYPKELDEGQNLIIRGKTYPNATVRIFLQKDDNAKIETQDVKSDNNGDFTLLWQNKLSSDIYKFWAEATDQRGAKSNPTDSYVLSVKAAALFQIGFVVINYLTIIISIIVVIGSLVFLGWNIWYRFNRYRNRLRKETSEAERTLHLSFDILRENIVHHIKLLEKAKSERLLTREETQIINKCKRDLSAAEELIGKEIRDIEKELK